MSNKGVDEEIERAMSGVIADLQHKVGGNTCPEEGNNKKSGGLTPYDTSHEYFMDMNNKYWEIQEEGLGSQIVDVQGRVRENLSFWREVLKAPDHVLDWIQCGYKLSLLYLPDNFYKGNHSLTQVHEKFVTETITQLLANRCIKKVDQRPHICSPLSVVKNANKKLHLVVNLRYLNQFLQI